MATQSYNGAPQSSAFVALALAVNSVVSVTAAPVAAATVLLTLSGAAASVQAATVSYASGNVVLTGATASLQANPIVSFVSRIGLYGASSSFNGAFVTRFLGDLRLTGSTATFTSRANSSFTGSANLTGASDSHGMSFCDVVDELLSMWGIFSRCSAPSVAIDRALNDINTSMQMVWNHADERNYWSSETLTITLADGTSSQNLPNDIQNVVGPCRRADNRRPLVPIGTIGELETFSDLYLDGEGVAEPVAYHVERMNQTGSDPAKCVFHVTPSVDGSSISFLLEVVKEAPRFTAGDFVACPVVPIPHRYVESLLLPIARYQASSFYLFRKADQKETIDREYQQARVSLGLADPLPGKAGDNLERREAQP
jgi:hypothetical protein